MGYRVQFSILHEDYQDMLFKHYSGMMNVPVCLAAMAGGTVQQFSLLYIDTTSYDYIVRRI